MSAFDWPTVPPLRVPAKPAPALVDFDDLADFGPRHRRRPARIVETPRGLYLMPADREELHEHDLRYLR